MRARPLSETKGKVVVVPDTDKIDQFEPRPRQLRGVVQSSVS